MRWDFGSESCFLGVLVNEGLAVVVEVSSDDAKIHGLLLLMFLSLLLSSDYL